MVSRLFALFEDIGHAVGVAHLNVPIAQSGSEAIVDTVETAWLPRGKVLLFLLALHIQHFIATYAEADLRPDAQSWNHRFIFVVLIPFSEVDVEQQRHVDVVRLLLVLDGVVAFIQAFP